MSNTLFSFFTPTEDDISPLFTTKLQEHACIGHLKGMFSTSDAFSLIWLKRNPLLFSPSFQSEVDGLLRNLQSGPLRDLHTMKDFCATHPQAYMHGRQPFYAFRIDTSENRYYLRIFPQEGKSKFFLFCYRTDRMRNDLPSPDFNYRYREDPPKKRHRKKGGLER